MSLIYIMKAFDKVYLSKLDIKGRFVNANQSMNNTLSRFRSFCGAPGTVWCPPESCYVANTILCIY